MLNVFSKNLRFPSKHYTYLLSELEFKMREIVLGPSMEDSYVVLDGLREGEEVVTNGTFIVDAAAQLAGKPSMMNSEKRKNTVLHDHSGMKM